jgi:hypothetical protein
VKAQAANLLFTLSFEIGGLGGGFTRGNSSDKLPYQYKLTNKNLCGF